MMDTQSFMQQISNKAVAFEHMDDLDVIVQAIGDADIVMLGEASHGTSEFYSVRAELSKRLIERKGFQFLAVEGDWPSCYNVNKYVKRHAGAAQSVTQALRDFNRWPTWMWANQEIVNFAEWIRTYNDTMLNAPKVGFYGLDVYSLWESMDEIIRYLERTGSKQLEQAKRAFSCFDPHDRDAQSYGIAAGLLGEDCEEELIQLLDEMKKKRQNDPKDEEAALDAEVNTLVAVNAEKYYRTMVRGGPESWNVRDRHMVEALKKIMEFYGPRAKAIIWEHNTHIGDARATDMAADGMVNVGQLLRERYGVGNTFTVGFGTYHGTVIAGESWGAPMEVMEVPPAEKDSWEYLVHQVSEGRNKIILFDENQEQFHQLIGHRAIGVVYNPKTERFGNYVPSYMAKRYDAFIHIDETTALRPIKVEPIYV